MDFELSDEQRKFFKNCECVSKAPACIFLEGDRFSKKAKVLPIPMYAYAGIEKGDFPDFEYEEFGNEAGKDTEQMGEMDLRKHEKKAIANLIKMPEKEEKRIRGGYPISSWGRHRKEYYPVFSEEVMKSRLISQKFNKLYGEKSGFWSERLSRKERLQIEKDIQSKDFKDYFKIKVFSEIPSCAGLNENAAIAVAVSFLFNLPFYESEDYQKERLDVFKKSRHKLKQGIVPQRFDTKMFDFLRIFEDALKLDFFSNGAAVFSSLMATTEPYKIVSYECLVHNLLKLFFYSSGETKRSESKRRKIFSKSPQEFYRREMEKLDPELTNGKYFAPLYSIQIKYKEPKEKLKEYFNLPAASWKDNILPLFKWSYYNLTEEEGQVLSVIERKPAEGEEFRNPAPNSGPDFKCWNISPFYIATFGKPDTIEKAMENPEKNVFDNPDFPMGNFREICSLSGKKWGAGGVELARLEKLKPAEEEQTAEKAESEPITKKVKINFSESEVQISGKEGLSKDNALILAEYIILKEKIHWLWSFVVLPKFETKKPKWQFRNYVSKKKNFLAKNGIKIIALRKGKDDYAKFGGIEDWTESNIKDIKNIYREAVSLFDKDRLKDAIEEINKITASNYKWTLFTDAYMKMIEWIRMNNFSNVSEKIIMDCQDFLRWYKKRLRVGILRIENYRKKLSKKKKKLDELGKIEFQTIKDELDNVKQHLQALVSKTPISKEEREYEEFAELLIEYRKKLNYVRRSNDETLEVRQESSIRAIIKLCEDNKHLKRIVDEANKIMGKKLYDLRRGKTYDTKLLIDESKGIYWFLCELILDIENFDKFETAKDDKLSRLKEYFIKGLKNKINRWFAGRSI